MESAYELANFGLEILQALKAICRFEPYDKKMAQFDESFRFFEGVCILMEE